MIMGFGLLALGQACSSESSPPASYEKVVVCQSDAECPSSVCAKANNTVQLGICATTCSSDNDCLPDAKGVRGNCGIDADGRKVCLATCVGNSNGDYNNSWKCKENHQIACNQSPAETCGCGCPQGQVCQLGVGCGIAREVGEPCEDRSWCKSNNCWHRATTGGLSPIGTCAQPIGEECTDDNCEQCVHLKNGRSYCTQNCNDYFNDSKCPNGYMCLTNQNNESSACYKICRSFSNFVASCKEGTTCTQLDLYNIDSYYYCDL
jgi:hypothetical protein